MKYIETELKKKKGMVEAEVQKVKVKNPEDYAIFYLDVFAESLSGDVPMPWQGSTIQWNDPIKLFQVSLIIPIVTSFALASPVALICVCF